MPLNNEQIEMLKAPLDPKLVKIKPTPGNPKFLEGHEAINNANRIFGHHGWGYTVDRIDQRDLPGGVLYTALVSVTVEGCHTKQDIGCEVASNTKDGKAPQVQAHDTAIKGAVTDGIKRALRSFGDQFGASLYDKDADLQGEYRDWQREQGQQEQPARQPAPPPTPPPTRTEATPTGGAVAPPQERPANIRDLAATIPDTRALAREETQARAADGQVVMERRRDGAVALNNVPLGEDGTAMFEALRKATTLDALGAEWTAVVANRTALSAPQLDILIRWKEQRKTELDQAGVAR